MGRKRVCIECGEPLRCKACGEPQNKKKSWKRTTIQFTPEQLKDIDAKAKKAGVSRAEYIRNTIGRMSDAPPPEDEDNDD